MSITADTQSMLMLCSHLGLGRQPDSKPLTLREWNPLAQAISKFFVFPPRDSTWSQRRETGKGTGFESGDG